MRWILSICISYKYQHDTNKSRSHCLKTFRQDGIKKILQILQYIPRNMHKVFALLCFVVVIHWLIFPYPSGLLHWHCGNLTIAPVPAKQPWWIWINTSCEFIMNDCITTTKQSTTKPCAYFLGYIVLEHSRCKLSYRSCKWRLFNGWTGPNSKEFFKNWFHRAYCWCILILVCLLPLEMKDMFPWKPFKFGIRIAY